MEALIIGLYALLLLGLAIALLRRLVQGCWISAPCPIEADLTDRIALITGCTVGGLGFATAEKLALRGAHVIMTCRTSRAGKQALAELRQRTGRRGEVVMLELLSNSEVSALVERLMSRLDRLDIVVLNAGIWGVLNPENVWQVNYVSHFTLVECLMPLLIKTARSFGGVRVVAVSCGAHRHGDISEANPYEVIDPYAQSKLAQIMHMRELQRIVTQDEGWDISDFCCVAVNPGIANTRLYVKGGFGFLRPLLWLVSRSPSMAAENILAGCIADVPGGSYISNCCLEEAQGRYGLADDHSAWRRLWTISQICMRVEGPASWNHDAAEHARTRIDGLVRDAAGLQAAGLQPPRKPPRERMTTNNFAVSNVQAGGSPVGLLPRAPRAGTGKFCSGFYSGAAGNPHLGTQAGSVAGRSSQLPNGDGSMRGAPRQGVMPSCPSSRLVSSASQANTVSTKAGVRISPPVNRRNAAIQ